MKNKIERTSMVLNKKEKNGIYFKDLKQYYKKLKIDGTWDKYYDISVMDFVKKIQKNRLDKLYDAYIGVTGEEGTGKSSWAFWIVYVHDKDFRLRLDHELPTEQELNELSEKYPNLNNIPLDNLTIVKIRNAFEPNFILTSEPEQKIKLISKVPFYGACWDDEAIKTMYKLDWSSKSQQMMTKEAVTNRKEFKIHLDCMPRFSDFTNSMRNGRIRYWIHVFDRGQATIKVKESNEFTKDDLWNIDFNEKLIKKYLHRFGKRNLNKDDYIKLFNRIKIFSPLIIRFPPMPSHVEACYKILCNILKRDNGSEVEQLSPNEKKWKERFQKIQYILDYIKENVLDKEKIKLNDKLISEIIGIHPNQYGNLKLSVINIFPSLAFNRLPLINTIHICTISLIVCNSLFFIPYCK